MTSTQETVWYTYIYIHIYGTITHPLHVHTVCIRTQCTDSMPVEVLSDDCVRTACRDCVAQLCEDGMHVATMSNGCVTCMHVQTACHGCTKTACIRSVSDKWTNTVASVSIVAKIVM